MRTEPGNAGRGEEQGTLLHPLLFLLPSRLLFLLSRSGVVEF
jgi:hypothetical protein